MLQFLDTVDKLRDSQSAQIAFVLKNSVFQTCLEEVGLGEFEELEQLNQRGQWQSRFGSLWHEEHRFLRIASLNIDPLAEVCCGFRDQIWLVIDRIVENDKPLLANLVVVKPELRMKVNGSSRHGISNAGSEGEVLKHFLPLVCGLEGIFRGYQSIAVEGKRVFNLRQVPVLLDRLIPRVILEVRDV